MIRWRKSEANLRHGYDRVLWSSLACSAVLNALLILLYPTSEPEARPEPPRPERPSFKVVLVPDIHLERRPPPPSRPDIGPWTDDHELSADETIEYPEVDLDLSVPSPPPVKVDPIVEPEPDPDDPVEMEKVEQRPYVKTRVIPTYPKIARKFGIEDTVFVMVLVNKEGNVEQIGEIRGAEVFHDAVREAVPKWSFNPAMQNDKPVKVWVNLPIAFILK